MNHGDAPDDTQDHAHRWKGSTITRLSQAAVPTARRVKGPLSYCATTSSIQ